MISAVPGFIRCYHTLQRRQEVLENSSKTCCERCKGVSFVVPYQLSCQSKIALLRFYIIAIFAGASASPCIFFNGICRAPRRPRGAVPFTESRDEGRVRRGATDGDTPAWSAPWVARLARSKDRAATVRDSPTYLTGASMPTSSWGPKSSVSSGSHDPSYTVTLISGPILGKVINRRRMVRRGLLCCMNLSHY